MLATAIVAALVLAFNPFAGTGTANAQASERARLMVADQNIPGDGPISVVAQLDPGSSRLGAITASLHYDPAVLSVLSCDAGATGVCNDLDGRVAFARLAIDGLIETTEMVVVEFEKLAETNADATDLSFEIKTAVDAVGYDLDGIVIEDGTLSFIEATGALTGQVLLAETAEMLHDIEVCISSNIVDTTCVDTGGLGTFRFDGLPSGEYSVVATDGSGALQRTSIQAKVTAPEITGGLEILLTPQTEDLEDGDESVSDAAETDDSEAASPGTISGRVVDTHGVPIFGLEVCAAQPLLRTNTCVYTTGTGEFAMSELRAGNYQVSVNDPVERYASASEIRYVGVEIDSGVSGVEIVIESKY